MIRIDLINKHGQLIKSIDFNGTELKVGRSLDCAIIIPDFSVKPVEVIVQKKSENKFSYQFNSNSVDVDQIHTIKFNNYKIIITNLYFYATQSEHQIPKKSIVWLKPLTIFISVFTLYTIFANIFATGTVSVKAIFEFILIMSTLFFGISLALSLVSKVINHEFNFWKILNLVFYISFTLMFFTNSLLELRWLPARIFENKILWNLFTFIIIFPLIWKLVFTICDHLEKKIKIILILVPISIYIVLDIIPIFPYQERYKFPNYRPRPAVFESLESKSITKDKLNIEIDTIGN